MKRIFEEWGGTIIRVIAVVTLIAFVTFIMSSNGVIAGSFRDIVQKFVQASTGMLDSAAIGFGGSGGSGESGGSADEPQANEHGFYFNQPYQAMMDGTLYEYVFYGDGDASMWMSMEDQHAGQYLPTGTCTYEPGTVSIGGSPVNASEDGKTLSGDGISMTVNFVTESNIQYGVMYENAAEDMAFVFKEDGSLELYGGGALQTTLPAGSVVVKEYTIEITAGSDTLVCPVYPDGSKLLFQDMVFCVSRPVLETPMISLSERVLTITPVENATGYELYIDDELICTTAETTVDLSAHLTNDASCYVKARAVAPDSHTPSNYNYAWFSLTEAAPGLYDADDNLLAPWPVLVNDYGMDITASDDTSPRYILTNNAELSTGVKIVIDSSVTTIGNGAFNSCTNLISVVIPASVEIIDAYAFSWCTSLESITFADNSQLSTIGERAFTNCTSLTSMKLPTNVETIGRYAFEYCTSLASIILPARVENIGIWAFSNCTNLEYNEYDNALYLGNEDNPYLALIQATNTSITSCAFHNETKVIAGSAFDSCYSLRSVIFEEGNQLTSIGDFAFGDCKALTSMVLPSTTRNIGDRAFRSCISLENLAFEGTVVQWAAIEKSSNWNENVPATEVVCSDGVVSLAD